MDEDNREKNQRADYFLAPSSGKKNRLKN